jgi:PAS domain S-box-containing protein
MEWLISVPVVVGIVGLAALSLGLAARVRALQGALRNADGKSTAILDAAVDGIVIIDEKGLIESFNRAAERIFGYKADEVVGQNVKVLMPDPYHSEHDQYLANYNTTGHARIIGTGREVVGRRKDGSTFPMDLAVGEGRMGGRRLFAGIVRDITERKRIDEALRAAKEAAERANLSQSKFLAAASHDLRQPVQALVLFASALETKIFGSPAASLLGDMKGSLDALNMLLDALLDVSRLDAGTIAPRETNFALSTLTERLLAEFAPLAGDKNIDIKAIHSSAIVRTDPTLLCRIIGNFLSNAVRYTSQGRILLGCRRRGRKLRIQVLDSGIGIPAHLHSEIFKEFYQIGNSERDRDKGLGLGLAIVDRLSRLLRCPVAVRSKEGRGSAFSVDVPLVGFNKSTNVVYLKPDYPREIIREKGIVFVIDDEASVLKGLQLVIEDWGYTVHTARTELEAIDILSGCGQAPDIVIADYRLRGICTGADVIQHIREVFSRPIPGILITGDTAPERIKEANTHGLILLHKPIHPSELHVAISDILMRTLLKEGVALKEGEGGH